MIAREKLLESIGTNCLYVCNHSGGKDSQAMYRWMVDNLPNERIVVVHAHLPGVEWEGTIPHIQKTCAVPVHIVQANKTFIEMVKNRGMFPSASYRQCTSDLKRNPISKWIRNYTKDKSIPVVYNCMGIRAEESEPRAQKEPYTVDAKLTIKSRTVYNVLPIHDYTVKDVFFSYNVTLEELQKRRWIYKLGDHSKALFGFPFIWTYVAGMSRHSCKICILANKKDLRCSATIDPDHFLSFIELEEEIDYQFINPNKHSASLLDIYSTLDQKQLKIA